MSILICMALHNHGGMKTLQHNYRCVLHALSGCYVSQEMGVMQLPALYKTMYSIAVSNLATNAKGLLLINFHIFDKIPSLNVPEQVLQFLQLTNFQKN